MSLGTVIVVELSSYLPCGVVKYLCTIPALGPGCCLLIFRSSSISTEWRECGFQHAAQYAIDSGVLTPNPVATLVVRLLDGLHVTADG